MSFADLEKLIQVTDDFMHDYLQNSTLYEGPRPSPKPGDWNVTIEPEFETR